jgi:hypothetical protein
MNSIASPPRFCRAQRPRRHGAAHQDITSAIADPVLCQKSVAGSCYATGNGFSARDHQLETGGQWMISKTPDQFAPLGPYLVTADQVIPIA